MLIHNGYNYVVACATSISIFEFTFVNLVDIRNSSILNAWLGARRIFRVAFSCISPLLVVDST